MSLLSDVNTKDWFTGYGTIRYDPDRSYMRKKERVDPRNGERRNNLDWWCIVDVDPEIARYYRWWANRVVNPLRYTEEDQQRHTWRLINPQAEDLLKPAHGAHMTIVRGEPPVKNAHLWRKYHGQRVEFKYSHNVRYSGDTTDRGDKNGRYWFVDAVCDLGKQIRDEFGLASHWTFHITIGRTKS